MSDRFAGVTGSIVAVVVMSSWIGAFALATAQQPAPAVDDYTGWAAYGGGNDQIRYSSLKQINKTNVAKLAVAWTYDTGESGATQTQPVVVDGVLLSLIHI